MRSLTSFLRDFSQNHWHYITGIYKVFVADRIHNELKSEKKYGIHDHDTIRGIRCRNRRVSRRLCIADRPTPSVHSRDYSNTRSECKPPDLLYYLATTLDHLSASDSLDQKYHIWQSNWVRLAPNGTNLGLFKISFSTFWLAETKCTEMWSEKVQDLSHLGQSYPV